MNRRPFKLTPRNREAFMSLATGTLDLLNTIAQLPRGTYRNQADAADVFLMDEIGKYSDGGIGAKDFKQEILSLAGRPIVMHVSSPGGSVFEGISMYSTLQKHTGHVTASITHAASIATVICCAADHVEIVEAGSYVVHSPFAGIVGESSDLRKLADVLDGIRDQIIAIYQAKTGLPVDKIRSMVSKETTMSGTEAHRLGFADAVIPNKRRRSTTRAAGRPAASTGKSHPRIAAARRRQEVSRITRN